MIKVKCIKNYYDISLAKTILAGDEYEVADARAKALSTANNNAGVPLVEIVETTTTTKKVVKAPSKKKEV